VRGWAGQPFDYWPSSGLYLLTYPVYYSSQKITNKDGKIGVSNLNLHVYQNFFRATYYDKGPWNKTWVVSAYWPVGRVDVLGQHDVGFGDPTVVAGYFPIDNAASKTFAGFGCYVDLPWGRYDKNKFANMGSNELRVRPMVTFAKLLGSFDVETALKYNIIFENKDTQRKTGNQILLEIYGAKFIGPKLLVGANFNAFIGKDNEVQGVKQADTAIRKYQAGPSLMWMPTPPLGIVLEVLGDFFTRNTQSGVLFLSRISWKV
jgi:hypothetical protein